MKFSWVDQVTPLVVRRVASASAEVVIQVAGEVDGDNSDRMRREILELLGADGAELDLAELTFLSSAGVRVLVECHEAAEQRGTRLEIGRAHRNVRQILTICGLTEMFNLPVE